MLIRKHLRPPRSSVTHCHRRRNTRNKVQQRQNTVMPCIIFYYCSSGSRQEVLLVLLQCLKKYVDRGVARPILIKILVNLFGAVYKLSQHNKDSSTLTNLGKESIVTVSANFVYVARVLCRYGSMLVTTEARIHTMPCWAKQEKRGETITETRHFNHHLSPMLNNGRIPLVSLVLSQCSQ